MFSDASVWEGHTDDGMGQQARSYPYERGKVSATGEGSSKELLRSHHVHRSTASETVRRLPVRHYMMKKKNAVEYMMWLGSSLASRGAKCGLVDMKI